MAIVCGTDFSEDARRAARAAVGLAGPAGDDVYLVHGLELPTITFIAGDGVMVPPTIPAPDNEQLRKEVLDKLEAEARSLGPRVKPVLSIGAPEVVLVEEAQRYQARLLVVGSHGASGAARVFIGSTADRLARSSPLPLLVVRGDAARFGEWAQRRRELRVLVCVDFEEATETVVGAALDLCRGGGCSLHLAHAIETPWPFLATTGRAQPAARLAELEGLVGEAMADLADRRQVPPDRVHILRGKPAAVLAKLAADEAFDLIVAGTHARRGIDRVLLGSVATGLLHRAPCPMLIAPISALPAHPSPPEPRPATQP